MSAPDWTRPPLRMRSYETTATLEDVIFEQDVEVHLHCSLRGRVELTLWLRDAPDQQIRLHDRMVRKLHNFLHRAVPSKQYLKDRGIEL